MTRPFTAVLVALFLACAARSSNANVPPPDTSTEADFDRLAQTVVEAEVADVRCVGPARITEIGRVNVYESQLRVLRTLRGQAPEQFPMGGSTVSKGGAFTDAVLHAGWRGKLYLMPVEGRLGLVHPKAAIESADSRPRALPDCGGPQLETRSIKHGCSGCFTAAQSGSGWIATALFAAALVLARARR